MRPLFKENFSDCTALQQASLGAAFRALPAEEQRRHAERVVAKADYYRPRKILKLSILTDRQRPPNIEHHRRRKTEWIVSFTDRERAIAWIIESYSLGFSVFNNGGGLGHPCEEDVR